jgi:predicted transcriptional regulator
MGNAMNTTELRPTTLKIDAQTRERIKRLAQARDRTPHWMMLEAIRQFVDREEAREQLRQEAIATWEIYRQTGLHVTAQEADAWLAQLERGVDAEPPRSHG